MWLQGKSVFSTTHRLMENLEYAFWTRNIPACIIPWAASTCPWPRRPKHLYRRIFIRPFRLFLDIVYGDLCFAFFISEMSGWVIKEMYMYISPGECLCPFNKKIWTQHNQYRLSEYRIDNTVKKKNCAFTCDK